MHACRSGLKFPPHHPDTHQPPLLGRSHVFGSGAATSCCVMYYETGAGRHHSTDRPACCPPPHAAVGWVAANEGPISTAARPLKPHGLAAVHEQQQQCNGGLATPPPPHPGPHQTLCSWGASHLQQARRRTTTTTSAAAHVLGPLLSLLLFRAGCEAAAAHSHRGIHGIHSQSAPWRTAQGSTTLCSALPRLEGGCVTHHTHHAPTSMYFYKLQYRSTTRGRCFGGGGGACPGPSRAPRLHAHTRDTPYSVQEG